MGLFAYMEKMLYLCGVIGRMGVFLIANDYERGRI